MTTNLHEVVFAGELLPGFEEAAVREAFGRLFQVGEERVAALFSGRRAVLKGNLDAPTAEKYRQALERIGARVSVEAQVPAPAQELAVTAAAAGTSGARLNVDPRDPCMAAFVHVDAPDFGLAPPGADLLDAPAPVKPPQLDLSALSLAPPGADLAERREQHPPRSPDIEHLRLVES